MNQNTSVSIGVLPWAPDAASSRRRLMSPLQLVGAILAIILPTIILLLPTTQGLPLQGQRTAAVFVGCLILWVTEPIPIPVTALLALIAQAVFGVAKLPVAFTNFMSPVFFFVLVMFVISKALQTTRLDRRFALWLVARAGTDTRRITLAFMMGCGFLSCIMSDVPACAIFMVIALPFFDKLGLPVGSSNWAKVTMMGIPIASLIGGVGTPAGSSINILGIYFIEQYGKVTIPFLSWMAIGMPMVILLIPIAWWVLMRFYPPEVDSIGSIEEIHKDREAIKKITPSEWKVLVLLCVMIILWILGSWIKVFDTTLIAVAGAIVMFLPGMKLFSWKDVQNSTSWDILLLIGGVTSLGVASAKTGLAGWLVGLTVGGIGNLSVVWIVAAICAFTVVIHLMLPINPAIIACFIPPLAMLAQSTGHNPALFTLPVAFTASCAFLLPLDSVPLLTYSKGYYKMFDMFLPGVVISGVWVILMTGILIFIAPLLGLM
jgi:solute carrier family 13 (sodium-dependent dicarboxylate transporter), member 2/3/5